MIGARVDIETADDGSLYAPLTLNTTQDITSWSFVAYIYHEDAPTTVLLILTVTKDITNKKIILEKDIADILTALENYTDGLKYNVLCKPGTVKHYRFFNGSFTFDNGGPLWVV